MTDPLPPLRCDECGRFLRYDDLESGIAIRRLTLPDSEFSVETYETLCPIHYAAERIRAALSRCAT